ncbi:Eco57I restriction-modification methylase domain-containing protein [Mycolicibacterium wolinskyi]|uniref:Eco57I restriction-modification methylase domain-containing protein n=1 Tax=Mycolicibacterium wolinskyi TaxID=59750 RepID=UPI003917A3A9
MAGTKQRPIAPKTSGVVYTQPWVVEMILDLAGYTTDQDLAANTIVEPAVGRGAFIVPIITRLIQSCARRRIKLIDAIDAIMGYDVDLEAVSETRQRTVEVLTCAGVSTLEANTLASTWIRHDDFLLTDPRPAAAKWVVGNPPYVRLEHLDRRRRASYRERWPTMRARADLYIGFLEAGIATLAKDGVMTTICADRWMRNHYGASLRQLIAQTCSVDACISMYGVRAFQSPVSVYTAVTRIRRSRQGPALTFEPTTPLDESSGPRLVEAWRRGPTDTAAAERASSKWHETWTTGSSSWPRSGNQCSLDIASLELAHPTLVDAGITVSVGPATGADHVFITPDRTVVEPDRLLPVIGSTEIRDGRLDWAGRYLVNPWDHQGLVSLADYPRLKRYLDRHRRQLAGRHTAQAHPEQWWRTIDRVKPGLMTTPKLLIRDINNRMVPVLDPGHFVPMHSVYFVRSSTWDLRVLGALLMSEIARAFIETYSVQMRGGYLRMTAQYLRKVRIPQYRAIPLRIRRDLIVAFEEKNPELVNHAARAAYGVDGYL